MPSLFLFQGIFSAFKNRNTNFFQKDGILHYIFKKLIDKVCVTPYTCLPGVSSAMSDMWELSWASRFSRSCVIMCSYWSISMYGVTIYPIVLSHWFFLGPFSPIILDVRDHWDLPTWPLKYHTFPLVFPSVKHLQHSGICSSLAWPPILTSTILHLFPIPYVNHIVSLVEILE